MKICFNSATQVSADANPPQRTSVAHSEAITFGVKSGYATGELPQLAEPDNTRKPIQSEECLTWGQYHESAAY